MSIEIRMQADDFFNAHSVLDKNNKDLFAQMQDSGKRPSSFPVMGPSIVCLAFAVELYIKDLHFVLKGKASRGHNILKLYTTLPRQIKREIFSHNSISQNPWNTRGPVFLPKRYAGAKEAYYGFLHNLKAISGGFEKWRYSYESCSLQYESSFAVAFVEAVKSAADAARTRLEKKERKSA